MAKIRRPSDLDDHHEHVRKELRHLRRQIDHTLLTQRVIVARLEALMSSAETMKASLVALGAALDNIAADIAGLKAGVKVGMTQEDVDTIGASLDAIGAKAQELADSTPDA